MKWSSVALAVVVLASLTAGCERERRTGDNPPPYDPKLDGAAPHARPVAAGDSNELRARLTGKPLPKPEGPAADPVAEVRAIVGDLAAAAKAKDNQKVLTFFLDSDASLIRPLVERGKTLEAKMKALEELAKTKLGMDMPKQDATKDLGFAQSMLGDPDKLIEGMQYQVVGETVVAASGANKTTFVKSGATWKIQMDDAQKGVLTILDELLTAMEKLADDLTAGINSGEITKENLQAKTNELGEKHVGPVMPKLFALMAKSMGQATGAAMTQPASGPAMPGMPTAPGQATSQPAPGQPDALGVTLGKTYRLVNPAQMYLGSDPFDNSNSIFLEAGTTVKFLEQKINNEGNARYKVEANAPDGKKLENGYLGFNDVGPNNMKPVD